MIDIYLVNEDEKENMNEDQLEKTTEETVESPHRNGLDEATSKLKTPEKQEEEKPRIEAPQKTRKDLQIPRRLFHFSCGMTAGLIYQLFLTHQQAVYILGIMACLFYVIEQLRINYPNSVYLKQINKYFLRAEEQLKESAAIPYLMALLLTIISFPKSIALVAIFTLASADPLSAIIGIRYGKHRIVKDKSLEGSAAFFVASFIACFSILFSIEGNSFWAVLAVSSFSSIFITSFEMIPIKLDDNLTIPLMTAIILWIITSYVGLNVV